MSNINDLNSFFRQQQIQKQAQANKVDEKLDEQNQEQSEELKEKQNQQPQSENFVERGTTLFDSMEYIAKASAGSVQNLASNKLSTHNAVCKLLSLDTDEAITKAKYNTSGKLTSFTIDNTEYAVTYNSSGKITKLQGKNGTKTVTTINCTYENGYLRWFDEYKYDESGKKTAHVQHRFNANAEGKKTAEHVFNVADGETTKVVTLFNDDDSKTEQDWKKTGNSWNKVGDPRTIPPTPNEAVIPDEPVVPDEPVAPAEAIVDTPTQPTISNPAHEFACKLLGLDTDKDFTNAKYTSSGKLSSFSIGDTKYTLTYKNGNVTRLQGKNGTKIAKTIDCTYQNNYLRWFDEYTNDENGKRIAHVQHRFNANAEGKKTAEHVFNVADGETTKVVTLFNDDGSQTIQNWGKTGNSWNKVGDAVTVYPTPEPAQIDEPGGVEVTTELTAQEAFNTGVSKINENINEVMPSYIFAQSATIESASETATTRLLSAVGQIPTDAIVSKYKQSLQDAANYGDEVAKKTLENYNNPSNITQERYNYGFYPETGFECNINGVNCHVDFSIDNGKLTETFSATLQDGSRVSLRRINGENRNFGLNKEGDTDFGNYNFATGAYEYTNSTMHINYTNEDNIYVSENLQLGNTTTSVVVEKSQKDGATIDKYICNECVMNDDNMPKSIIKTGFENYTYDNSKYPINDNIDIPTSIQITYLGKNQKTLIAHSINPVTGKTIDDVALTDFCGNDIERYTQTNDKDSSTTNAMKIGFDYGYEPPLPTSVEEYNSVAKEGENTSSYIKADYVIVKSPEGEDKYTNTPTHVISNTKQEINNAEQSTITINNTEQTNDITVNQDGSYVINKTTTISENKVSGTIKGENVDSSTWSKSTSDKAGNKHETLETTVNGAKETHSVNEYASGLKTVTDSANGNKSTIQYDKNGNIISALIIDGESGMYISQNEKGERTVYNKDGELIKDESSRGILDWGNLIIQGAKDAYEEGLYWSNASNLQKTLYAVAGVAFIAAGALGAAGAAGMTTIGSTSVGSFIPALSFGAKGASSIATGIGSGMTVVHNFSLTEAILTMAVASVFVIPVGMKMYNWAIGGAKAIRKASEKADIYAYNQKDFQEEVVEPFKESGRPGWNDMWVKLFRWWHTRNDEDAKMMDEELDDWIND